MEILIILIFILLGIILPIKIFKPTFILLAGLGATPWGGLINLPYITSINGNVVTYVTLDPLLQWAFSLMLIVTSFIIYLDSIDAANKGGKNESD